jgi:hypothetical protein
LLVARRSAMASGMDEPITTARDALQYAIATLDKAAERNGRLDWYVLTQILAVIERYLDDET